MGWGQSVKNIIPVNIRQYGSSIMGNRGELNESHFSNSDKQSIIRAVLRNMKHPGSEPNTIGYFDYGKKENHRTGWEGSGSGNGVSPIGAMIKSFTDPAFRMETTLGMANYHTDDNGDVIVTDTYDFGAPQEVINQKIKENGGSKIKTYLQLARERQSNFEGKLNIIGNLFAGGDGTGAPVRINLGNPNSWGSIEY